MRRMRVDLRLAVEEIPQEHGQTLPLLQGEQGAGVIDRRVDLEPVADDAGVGHQPRPVLIGVAHDAFGVETVERFAKGLALAQDGQPRQAGLKTFQDQFLKQLLVIGVGADYSERGHASQIVGAVDATYIHPNGLSIYGAFLDRYTNHNFGFYSPSSTGASITAPPASVLNKPTNEYAAVIQAGYLINQHVEPFARFEYLKLLGTAAGSKKYIPVVAAGANYYFHGHSLKLTGQVTYLPTGLPVDDTGNDLLASPSGKGEVVGIVQVQFAL